MATYFKIAPYNRNLGGITSKGYVITMKPRAVIVKWGSIKSISRKFYWAGRRLPQVKTIKFRTTLQAKQYYQEKVKDKISGGYLKMPRGKRIMKFKDL